MDMALRYDLRMQLVDRNRLAIDHLGELELEMTFGVEQPNLVAPTDIQQLFAPPDQLFIGRRIEEETSE